MPKMPTGATICIVYGFAEGPAVGRALRAALTDAGFSVIKDPAQADIIIAHSGGCFVLPAKHQAKLVVIIGLTHWPKKPLIVGTAQKVWQDFQAHRQNGLLKTWLRKSGWNLVYAGNMRRNLQMLRGQRRGAAWQTSAARLVLVRNKEDTFCTPDLHNLPFKTKPIVVELIGQHDDCWLHPAPYVAIVQS